MCMSFYSCVDTTLLLIYNVLFAGNSNTSEKYISFSQLDQEGECYPSDQSEIPIVGVQVVYICPCVAST